MATSACERGDLILVHDLTIACRSDQTLSNDCSNTSAIIVPDRVTSRRYLRTSSSLRVSPQLPRIARISVRPLHSLRAHAFRISARIARWIFEGCGNEFINSPIDGSGVFPSITCAIVAASSFIAANCSGEISSFIVRRLPWRLRRRQALRCFHRLDVAPSIDPIRLESLEIPVRRRIAS